MTKVIDRLCDLSSLTCLTYKALQFPLRSRHVLELLKLLVSKSLSRTLEKYQEIKAHFMEFMQKILDSHHTELAPPVDCRDILRFIWYKDDDPAEEVVDYRMRVHVFGNSPSPAVAIYGLRKVAQEGKRLCPKVIPNCRSTVSSIHWVSWHL
ncbi:hypothetical protein QQF64_020425 [Cirrhinus molitorella]|uniref:Uncharacterized protein n=1 Tax=Cirrhinus molitorella TaxID=172907 RepID=A0ABR3LAN2_9TELE